MASAFALSSNPPDVLTFELSIKAWTFGRIVLSVIETPTEPATPLPPNCPESAKAPAAARMLDVSVAERLIPPLPAMISREEESLIKASVVLSIALLDPAPAAPNFTPLPEPAATATPIERAEIVGLDVALTAMPPVLVSLELTSEAVVAVVTVLTATATPAATPAPLPFGTATATPPAAVITVEVSSTRTCTAVAEADVALTPAALEITAVVALRMVLIETDPPIANDEPCPVATAPATVIALI